MEMSDQESWPVKVYIYDNSKGMVKPLSRTLLGKQIDGVWHTGIVVYGEEFNYGGEGIMNSPPGRLFGHPDSIVDLGHTRIPYEVFRKHLRDLSRSSFRPSCYHLLDHNCNTFSSELAQFLTGNDIPSYITALPGEVLSTPLGRMIGVWIDAASAISGECRTHRQSGEHRSQCPSGERHTQCPSRERHTQCPPRERHTQCPPRERHTQCTSGERHTQCPPRERHTQCPPRERHTQCPPGERRTQFSSGERHTQCPPGERHTQCPPGERRTQFSSGERRTQFVSQHLHHASKRPSK
ncbi:desumoylating isopeptidase 1-like isoform X2 [Crassostrea virginica]